MCGIFGFATSKEFSEGSEQLAALLTELFHLSASRGSEASGLAIADGRELSMFRRAQPAHEMLKTPAYKKFVSDKLTNDSRGLMAIGHSRLVTNGSQGLEENNQPIMTEHSIGVHNGIVVNDSELFDENPDIIKRSQVDSEVIFRLFDKHFKVTADALGSIRSIFSSVQGEASIALLHDSVPGLILATNVGSLYWLQVPRAGLLVFASERYFLLRLISRLRTLFSTATTGDVQQLSVGNALFVSRDELEVELHSLGSEEKSKLFISAEVTTQPPRDLSPRRRQLRRCTRCILPHTFPFIEFDEKGVCNYCRETPPKRTDNRDTLEERVGRFRSKDGAPDCIVALSGGRDSCYGLHVIKKDLGFNPIAYTYDWAMVTDEARRNCSRICGELGVEHIVRSADIGAKRRNIRLNINAWLQRPELGMIPLFMAGDKQFFHYATQVSRQTNIPLVFFCGGNNLEVTRFKTGFCGVKDQSVNTMVGLDLPGKLKLLAYYAKNYILNPRYLNRSVLDTLFAFYTTYVNRQDFVYLYKYIEWDEGLIADTLSRYYGWESADDSSSTWRIGDGTAAFYNFIYHTVAGFSEHDTFRSNQIREGLISREEALLKVEEENRPRYAAMKEYAALVGFSLDEALTTINNIPKIE